MNEAQLAITDYFLAELNKCIRGDNGLSLLLALFYFTCIRCALEDDE